MTYWGRTVARLMFGLGVFGLPSATHGGDILYSEAVGNLLIHMRGGSIDFPGEAEALSLTTRQTDGIFKNPILVAGYTRIDYAAGAEAVFAEVPAVGAVAQARLMLFEPGVRRLDTIPIGGNASFPAPFALATLDYFVTIAERENAAPPISVENIPITATFNGAINTMVQWRGLGGTSHDPIVEFAPTTASISGTIYGDPHGNEYLNGVDTWFGGSHFGDTPLEAVLREQIRDEAANSLSNNSFHLEPVILPFSERTTASVKPGQPFLIELNANASVDYASNAFDLTATAVIDPVLEFDQAAFDAQYGENSFPLKDFFTIQLSPNLQTISSVPEPSSLALLTMGMIALAVTRRAHLKA